MAPAGLGRRGEAKFRFDGRAAGIQPAGSVAPRLCDRDRPAITLCVGHGLDTMEAIPGGVDSMKLIIAIIQPNKLESVKQALSEVEVFRLTVLDVQGFGRQRGHPETYRGHEIAVNLLRKVQLQIAVNDTFVEPTIAAIVKGGRSGERGEIGDGKIFVLPMDECVRIRTGERGGEAI
jgi:nitrogen regulatory protein P-II 2